MILVVPSEKSLPQHHPLLENNIVSLFPNTPHYSCPNTSPKEVLFATNLYQMKTLKVTPQVIVLDKQDVNPSEAR